MSVAPVLPILLNDGVSAVSTRVTLTMAANATAFQLGTEQTIDASTSANANGLVLCVPAGDPSAKVSLTDTILNIEIDGTVAWAVGVGYLAPSNNIFVLPGFIPAGSNVTAQMYGEASSTLVIVASFLSAAGGQQFGAPVNLTTTNHVVGTSAKGIGITVPGSNNTKGAWTQLVASTSADLCALAIQVGGNSDISLSDGNVLLDIGVGGAGSEVPLLADLYLESDVNEAFIPLGPMTYGVVIPAGTRLSARYQTSVNGNSLDVNLNGALVP